MTTTTLIPYESLRPGDRVKITQRIKVGLTIWTTTVAGTVERTERRREGLDVKRNFDDKAFADLIILKKTALLAKKPRSPWTNSPASKAPDAIRR